MARPKKQRALIDGTLLPENLYAKNKKITKDDGNEYWWIYKSPNGHQKARKLTVKDAVRMADGVNAITESGGSIKYPAETRDQKKQSELSYQVEAFVDWIESYQPEIKDRATWHQRKLDLEKFAEAFRGVHIKKLTLLNLSEWWEPMTYHMQHSRRPTLNKFFNYLMKHNLVLLNSNPFTKDDKTARCEKKQKPKVKRGRLHLKQYWIIYNLAGEMGYPGLQTAMGLSFLTTMRRADIASLRFDEHLVDGYLRKAILKTVHQRGEGRASRLEWKLSEHHTIRDIINNSRELSMKNFGCPYVVSHLPKQRRTGKTKTHICQLTADRLSELFTEVCIASGLYSELDLENSGPPTFHEVRSLGSRQLKAEGHEKKMVSELLAHTDEKTTDLYLSGAEYISITMSLTAEQLGGSF